MSVRATALFDYNFTGRVPAKTLLLISSRPVVPRNMGASGDSGVIARGCIRRRIGVNVTSLHVVVSRGGAMGRLGFS